MRQYIVDHGYTVADIMDCSKGENHMCLIQMGSPEEAIKALAKLHNVNPEGYQTRNNAGLCFSFSGRKSTKSPNDDWRQLVRRCAGNVKRYRIHSICRWVF